LASLVVIPADPVFFPRFQSHFVLAELSPFDSFPPCLSNHQSFSLRPATPKERADSHLFLLVVVVIFYPVVPLLFCFSYWASFPSSDYGGSCSEINWNKTPNFNIESRPHAIQFAILSIRLLCRSFKAFMLLLLPYFLIVSTDPLHREF